MEIYYANRWNEWNFNVFDIIAYLYELKELILYGYQKK